MLTDLMLVAIALGLFFAVATSHADGPPVTAPPRENLGAACGRSLEGGRWWLWTDLNCRPNDYESFALTN